LLKLKKNPKLVIIFGKIDYYISFINEIYTAKIPVITFGKSSFLKEDTILYNVPATSEFLEHNKNLFYNCLNFIFKKPNITLEKSKPSAYKQFKTTKFKQSTKKQRNKTWK
jgi:hypothetical protein